MSLRYIVQLNIPTELNDKTEKAVGFHTAAVECNENHNRKAVGFHTAAVERNENHNRNIWSFDQYNNNLHMGSPCKMN